jgi:hypothetical protein
VGRTPGRTPLGLTLGCRPHLILAVLPLSGLFAIYLVRELHLPGAAAGKATLQFCGPMAICGIALLWYNYARFGNPLEFGQAYQLTASPDSVGPRVSLQHLLPNLRELLIYLPARLPEFPFLKLRPSAASLEPTAGVAAVMPLCVLGALLTPFLLWRPRWMTPRVSFVLTCLLAVALPVVILLGLIGWSTLRYQVDYSPALGFAALFVLLLVSARAKSAWVRRGVTILVVAGCLWGAIAGTLLSINGYGLGLEVGNPRVFESIQSWFL